MYPGIPPKPNVNLTSHNYMRPLKFYLPKWCHSCDLCIEASGLTYLEGPNLDPSVNMPNPMTETHMGRF